MLKKLVKKKPIDPIFISRYKYVLVLCGLVGLLAASILTIEKIKLIQDPTFQPSCNISPLISCGSVMKTPQASAFGFPNSLIGIMGFSVVLTIGMGLLAGAQFKRWFWLGLQAGAIFGICFISWLIFQSVFRIGALCPYCMIVWSVMIPIFWYTTLHNLYKKHIVLPSTYDRQVSFFYRHHGDVLIVIYLFIAGIILNRFWYYWSSLI